MGGLIVNTTVPGGTEGFAHFGPGDDVPEWAARLMGEHCFENGEHPYPEAESDDSADSEVPDRAFGEEPARGGPKATKDAWVAFAGEKEFEIPAEAKTRGDVIAAMVAAGVIEAK